jgi:hypothetical protein
MKAMSAILLSPPPIYCGVADVLEDILNKVHTDRTRFGNATRIFNFQKQIRPSADKIFKRYADQIANIA